MLAVAKQHAIAHGWRNARVQQIAADAGVSRPTLYKEFPSKEELGAALFRHEVTGFLGELREAIELTPGYVQEALYVGVLYALTEAERGPFLAAVLTEDRGSADNLLPNLTAGSPTSIIPIVSLAVLEMIRERAPEDAAQERLAFAASTAVRLTLSELLEPSGDSAEVVSERIAELCFRYLHG